MRLTSSPFLASAFFATTATLCGCGGSSHPAPAAAVPTPVPVVAAHYAATPLGILPGYSYSSGTAINSLGLVVGLCLLGGTNPDGSQFTHFRAFLYAGGRLHDVGIPDGYVSSTADGIDEAGNIIVNTEAPVPSEPIHRQPFLYHNLVPALIPTPGSTVSNAVISPGGQIAGTAQTASGLGYAFLSDGQTLQKLSLPPGYASVEVAAINTAKDLAGTASNGDPASVHAAFYHAGTWTDLGTLTGLGGSRASRSQSNAINASDQIAGTSGTEAIQHAFLWSQGKMQDLGALSSGGSSQGNAINDHGAVVGTSTALSTGAVTVPHAFIFAQGQMKDLNDLLPAGSGWVLQSANGINAAGQITGDGLYQGKDQAFLLTPAP